MKADGSYSRHNVHQRPFKALISLVCWFNHTRCLPSMTLSRIALRSCIPTVFFLTSWFLYSSFSSRDNYAAYGSVATGVQALLSQTGMRHTLKGFVPSGTRFYDCTILPLCAASASFSTLSKQNETKGKSLLRTCKYAHSTSFEREKGLRQGHENTK